MNYNAVVELIGYLYKNYLQNFYINPLNSISLKYSMESNDYYNIIF